MVHPDRKKQEELLCLGWLWKDTTHAPSLCSMSLQLATGERWQWLHSRSTNRVLWYENTPAWIYFLHVPVLPWQLLGALIPVHATQCLLALLKFSCSDTLPTFSRKDTCPAGTAAIHNVANSEDVTGQRNSNSLDWGPSACQILTLYSK